MSIIWKNSVFVYAEHYVFWEFDQHHSWTCYTFLLSVAVAQSQLSTCWSLTFFVLQKHGWHSLLWLEQTQPYCPITVVQEQGHPFPSTYLLETLPDPTFFYLLDIKEILFFCHWQFQAHPKPSPLQVEMMCKNYQNKANIIGWWKDESVSLHHTQVYVY